MKKRLIIVGAGHLAKEITAFIRHYDLFEIAGFTVNRDRITESSYLGAPVYPMEDLEEYIDKDSDELFIAISWYHSMMGLREEKFNELKNRGFRFANVISPRAVIWTEDLGEGNWICDNVYIGYQAKLGANCILHPGCHVQHYCQVGDNCIITDMSMLAGHVTLGDKCFVGVSSVFHNRVKVGRKCVIGGGSVIKNDVPDYSMSIANNATIVQRDVKSIEKYVSLARLKK